ncbi:non-homologous end-joining DNA ligase [Herbiconiux sp. L3-i23]|uniref:non-homologous end-joining DNA ligase n=1 Tax=Herbiconiux sp. L3-i23 TaxID=2905871 RepID=UPI0020697696|nr:non-homologous end-joining DNA ligase [Herbiconiux sp. L3-i23]BDI23846.1 ATP-dependent DNA ligase [Herbiconiux sp. L3-i23]
MASEAITLEVDGPDGPREMRVSSPSRVVWPEPGVTKLELVEYLVAVGEPFVRANGDRPVALQRYPADIDGEMFFSKNPPRGKPEFIREVMVTYPSARAHPQLVIDEPAALVWMAQMNTVVFHPWPSRAGDIDHPDQMRLDLDPQPGRGFEDAVRAAHVLRDVLSEAGLTAMAKTSGNRGIHVFAPIEPRWDFIDVRHAVIAAARELERRMPDEVTTAWWKEERGEKVFVDFNQAARDRTIAGAYSPRATAAATVSMPFRWEDLDDLSPLDFTVRSVPGLLAERGDAWGDEVSPGVLDVLLEWWERDVANGQGEMPYPPDYPKMPGEPPRVQPSKARKPAAD